MVPTNTPFSATLVPTITKYMQEQLPREGCGLVVDNKFVPCKNISESDDSFKMIPKDYFPALVEGKIQCLVHSHNNKHNLSKLDTQQQISMDVPWGVFNFVDNKLDDIVFWGDSIKPLPLVGRRFWYGSHDCFGLVRDWWRLKGHTMLNFARGTDWNINKDIIEDSLEHVGWHKIELKDLQEGDGLLFTMLQKKHVDHLGVYIGDDSMIHQVDSVNALSRRSNVSPWLGNLKYCVRYKENQC